MSKSSLVDAREEWIQHHYFEQVVSFLKQKSGTARETLPPYDVHCIELRARAFLAHGIRLVSPNFADITLYSRKIHELISSHCRNHVFPGDLRREMEKQHDLSYERALKSLAATKGLPVNDEELEAHAAAVKFFKKFPESLDLVRQRAESNLADPETVKNVARVVELATVVAETIEVAKLTSSILPTDFPTPENLAKVERCFTRAHALKQ